MPNHVFAFAARPLHCAGLCLGVAIALAASAGATRAAAAADQDEAQQTAASTRDNGPRAAALSGGADAAIRREVLQRLEADPHVNIADLQVVVQDGIITLKGRVATYAEKHIAARGADDVRGSQGVVNAIEVVPGLRETVPPAERPAGVEQER